MTEQTDKPKVQTVIASGEVELWEDIPKFVYSHRCLSADIPCEHLDLPIGTPVEIVAVTDAEPKRKLVPGPGEWKKSKVHELLDQWDFINKEGVIASVRYQKFMHPGFSWVWELKCDDENKGCSTLELAQRAAEEAKATAGEDGFHWEEVEPEYIRFIVSGTHTDHSIEDRTEAFNTYRTMHEFSEIATIEGVLSDLTKVELDRREASGK